MMEIASVNENGEGKGPAVHHVEGAPYPVLDANNREYILTLHHTLDLHPLPSTDPKDPLNWPTWKKNVQLGMVSFHAMMATFSAGAIVPGFKDFAEMYDKTLPEISYLVSVQVSNTSEGI
jgi:hypothetical protein